MQSICPEDSLLLFTPLPPPTLEALAFPTYIPGLGYPPSRTLVPIHVVVFAIPLHVRHGCHQVFQEVKLLLQLNALLPGRSEKERRSKGSQTLPEGQKQPFLVMTLENDKLPSPLPPGLEGLALVIPSTWNT